MNIILCNFNDNRPRLEKIDNLNAEYRIEDVQVDEARTKQFKDLHDKEHNGNKNFKNPNIYENTSEGPSKKQNYIHPLEFRNISYDGRRYLDEVGEKALKARISQGIKNKHFLDKGENKVKYLSNDLETKLLTIPISISTPHPVFTEDYYGSFVYRNPSFKKLRYGCGVERAVYSKNGRIPVYFPRQLNIFRSHLDEKELSRRGSFYDPVEGKIVIDNYRNPDELSDDLRYGGFNSRKDYESPEGGVYEDLRHEAGHSINEATHGDVSEYYLGSFPSDASKSTYGENPSELTNAMGLFKSEAYGQTGKIINNQKEYYEVLKENTFIGKDGKRYWKNTGDPVTVEAGRLINYIDSNRKGYDSMIEDNNLWQQVVKNNTRNSSNLMYS